VNPPGVEIQETEDQVADIGGRQDEHVVDIRSSSKLNPRLVSIALLGAPWALSLDRYFGNQPSTEAW